MKLNTLLSWARHRWAFLLLPVLACAVVAISVSLSLRKVDPHLRARGGPILAWPASAFPVTVWVLDPAWEPAVREAADDWHRATGLELFKVRGAGMVPPTGAIVLDSGIHQKRGHAPPIFRPDGTIVAGRVTMPPFPEVGLLARVVATHELGHQLGLAHSRDRGSVMVSTVRGGEKVREWERRAVVELYGADEAVSRPAEGR